MGTVPVKAKDKTGAIRIVKHIIPSEVHTKRNASAAVYKKHA